MISHHTLRDVKVRGLGSRKVPLGCIAAKGSTTCGQDMPIGFPSGQRLLSISACYRATVGLAIGKQKSRLAQ